MNDMNHLDPLHQMNELELFYDQIPIPLISFQQEIPIIQQQMNPTSSYGFDTSSVKLDIAFQSSNKNDEGAGNNNSNNKRKKVTHREVEKQRRLEMAGLYQSLRSLLPHGCLKGKRSISDNMNEATKHIRQQQIKIEELVKKRDELKRFSNSSTCKDIEKQSCCSKNCVTVQPWLAGVEVIVDCDLKSRGVALSDILGLLAAEGLQVICCATTKVNEHSIYTIQSEVLNPDNVELSSLQRKLIDLNHLYENHS